jgi:hypothetical protein
VLVKSMQFLFPIRQPLIPEFTLINGCLIGNRNCILFTSTWVHINQWVSDRKQELHTLHEHLSSH